MSNESQEIKLLTEAYTQIYSQTEELFEMTDYYEFLLGYLIGENFADDVESAHAIIENMSEEWMNSIFEQNLNEVSGFGRVILRSIADAAKRGMRVTPARKLENKLGQLNRQIQNVERKGDLKDLENIEQRMKKLSAVRDSRSMQKSRQAVRDITTQYK